MTIDPSVVLAAIGALVTGLAAVSKLIYSDLKRDRDFWRDAYLAADDRTEDAIRVAKKAARG